jgi:hypothetical protein
MKYKCTLPDKWIRTVSGMVEFANGATQVTVRTQDGSIYPAVLISSSKYIVAMRNFKNLPFALEDIADIYQTDEDKKPRQRGNWEYWDKWD